MAEAKLCAVEGCGKKARSRGWCPAHYQRWLRYGSADALKRPAPNKKPPETCTVEGCDKPHQSLGYCSVHYHRHRRHGDVNTTLRPGNGATLQWIQEHLAFAGEECLIWPFASGGRGDAVVFHDGRMRSASRVMCEMAHGLPPEPDLECAHSCGHGHLGCMNPRHLRWDTRSGNHADKVGHGTHNRGSRHPRAKLSEADAAAIRGSSLSVIELVRKHGISRAHVYDIRSGKKWAHLAP